MSSCRKFASSVSRNGGAGGWAVCRNFALKALYMTEGRMLPVSDRTIRIIVPRRSPAPAATKTERLKCLGDSEAVTWWASTVIPIWGLGTPMFPPVSLASIINQNKPDCVCGMCAHTCGQENVMRVRVEEAWCHTLFAQA